VLEAPQSVLAAEALHLFRNPYLLAQASFWLDMKDLHVLDLVSVLGVME
jgi:hypothetical protein